LSFLVRSNCGDLLGLDCQHLLEHFPRCHDHSLSETEKLESLGIVFFAPGNDARAWLTGWHPAAGKIGQAMQASDPETWQRGGDGPILIVQPLQDAMLPTEAGREFAAMLGARASYVEVPNCGHAILPEQPELVARHVIRFLDAHS
jgi:pimeloyl-ACP methyl ester carboxylesterase